MFPLLSVHIALSTFLVYSAGQEFHGPGLGGMSYHPYPSRNAYVPTREQAPLGPLPPLREAPNRKQFRPLLHDFHTPVHKDFGPPSQSPINDIGINAALPGQFSGLYRQIPTYNRAFNEVDNSLRKFNSHAGSEPLLRPAVKDIPINYGPAAHALLPKADGIQNEVPRSFARNTLQPPGFDVYPNEVGGKSAYLGPRHLNAPFVPYGPSRGFAHQNFGPGTDDAGFGRLSGYEISEPFLTPVARYSNGYTHHRVPLALVEGGFVGHHFGRPVVHGIVKAGVPVSLARGW